MEAPPNIHYNAALFLMQAEGKNQQKRLNAEVAE